MTVKDYLTANWWLNKKYTNYIKDLNDKYGLERPKKLMEFYGDQIYELFSRVPELMRDPKQRFYIAGIRHLVLMWRQFHFYSEEEIEYAIRYFDSSIQFLTDYLR